LGFTTFLTLILDQNSILEVAVRAPCFNNNQLIMQKRLFLCLSLCWVAVGCSLVLQVVRLIADDNLSFWDVAIS
jgi:hypothetical protein